MNRMRLIATAVALVVFTMLAGRADAQQTNAQERTFLTFSGAAEMPGLMLPAGTYVFKLADTLSRNVVQVWDRREENILGQWLFVQASRLDVTEESVIMFRETPAGTPPAVQYWYYPGERIGKEFIYPKEQAQRIARAWGRPVLASEGEIDLASSVSSINPEGSVTEWRPEPVETPVVAATPFFQEQPTQIARAELPRTASPLPLAGLLGLLSLAGAAAVRFVRQ